MLTEVHAGIPWAGGDGVGERSEYHVEPGERRLTSATTAVAAANPDDEWIDGKAQYWKCRKPLNQWNSYWSSNIGVASSVARGPLDRESPGSFRLAATIASVACNGSRLDGGRLGETRDAIRDEAADRERRLLHVREPLGELAHRRIPLQRRLLKELR